MPISKFDHWEHNTAGGWDVHFDLPKEFYEQIKNIKEREKYDKIWEKIKKIIIGNMTENYDCIVDNGNVIDISNNTGWVCPKCGAIVSPSVLVCPVCGGKRTNENLAPGESMICG